MSSDAHTSKAGALARVDEDQLVDLSFVVPSPRAVPDQVLHQVQCARVPIAACSPDRAVDEVLRLARPDRARGADVHLCNAYTLSLADRSDDYRTMLQRATLNLADGKSVAWANRLTGTVDRSADRIRGNDLFLDVVARGQEQGTRHYLLGSTPEVLANLQSALEERCPRARIVGFDSPPFRPMNPEEKAAQIARIRDAGTDIVWVGLGTPKQDVAAHELAAHGVVAVAIGAAFDFISGSKPEAPRWMQTSGLEWVHRLSTEPRRLWRRYLFGNSRFAYAAYRHRRAQAVDADT